MTNQSRRDFAKSLAAMPIAVCLPFAKHLSEEERAMIEKNISDAASTLERLRAFPLTNADEPDFV
jgi:hypothetical protein